MLSECGDILAEGRNLFSQLADLPPFDLVRRRRCLAGGGVLAHEAAGEDSRHITERAHSVERQPEGEDPALGGESPALMAAS